MFGVYVHIPFCAKRCDYCAFATWTDRDHLRSAYVHSVVAEVQAAVRTGMPVATSVFFGGGTPSLLTADELLCILDAIPLTTGCEVTVECNPDAVDAEKLVAYRAGGVNRVSFGVQSMVPHVLQSLGRTHDPKGVARAVEWARAAGFTRFNLDLIYGAKGESIDDWRRTLDAVLAFAPPHVSAYGLTVEGGTPLAEQPDRHPDDDDLADKYVLAEQKFAAAGLVNYEISNWSVAGGECAHNWLYWAQGEYLGFGCAAHSHRSGERFWNVRTPERYIERIDAGESARSATEHLDATTRAEEALQLALRTRRGVPCTALDVAGIEHLVRRVGDDRFVLTVEGRLLANEVSHRLVT